MALPDEAVGPESTIIGAVFRMQIFSCSGPMGLWHVDLSAKCHVTRVTRVTRLEEAGRLSKRTEPHWTHWTLPDRSLFRKDQPLRLPSFNDFGRGGHGQVAKSPSHGAVVTLQASRRTSRFAGFATRQAVPCIASF